MQRTQPLTDGHGLGCPVKSHSLTVTADAGARCSGKHRWALQTAQMDLISCAVWRRYHIQGGRSRHQQQNSVLALPCIVCTNGFCVHPSAIAMVLLLMKHFSRAL